MVGSDVFSFHETFVSSFRGYIIDPLSGVINWGTEIITPVSGVVTLLTTGGGPTS